MKAGALGMPDEHRPRRLVARRRGARRDERGTILLAGHVDSAKRGAGAFYALKRARRGDRIQLRSDDGRTTTLPRHLDRS